MGRRVARGLSDFGAYSSPSGRESHLVNCGWFWAWAAVGSAGAVGLVSLGPVALVPAVIAAAAMLRSQRGQRSMFGLLTGAGLLSLFVAYVQRAGPGTTCWHTATASGCDQHLNPIPWLVAGLLLVLGGVVGHVRRVR